ncbi:MAG: nucleoside kinase [Spirochaetia bacterium]
MHMEEVNVSLPSKETVTVESGTTIETLLDKEQDGYPIVAAMVNNYLTSLSYQLEVNSRIAPVGLNTPEGLRVYRQSLCFLLAIASKKLYPNRRLTIGHSLGDGYYYTFDDSDGISEDEATALETQMRELVGQDLPIVRRVISYEDALEHFRTHWMTDTALLLENRNDHKVPIYECGDFIDLGHGPLAPSTGRLQWFEVMRYRSGFLLRHPNSRTPMQMQEFHDIPVLFSIYQEYKEWGRILGVNSAGRLNTLLRTKGIRDFIWTAEALHTKKTAEIADRIQAQQESARIVLIAGPSSSGKTTFTKKLAIQLRAIGLRPVTINLDDYFVPRSETPLDESGKPDFEAIEAIDTELLNEDLISLLDGEEVSLPSFDFKTGQRFYENTFASLPERGIIVMEGIHGLNEALTPRLPSKSKFRIYVSALTQLNLDDHTRVSTTDNRLIRRLVRDAQFRNREARGTLEMWPSVRRGEDRNIFPFQDKADVAFNSALDYELGVLKPYAEPLLREVKPYDHVYHEAIRLMNFLDNFTAILSHQVPDQSILREFIGNSAFDY